MSDEAPKRYEGGRHEGPASTSPYPLSRLSPAYDLVDVAREIQQADRLLGAVVGGQLSVIADQIRALQDRAHALLEKARHDRDLHAADCRFKKQPGAVYHLYRRPDGQRYFSLLSPDDWKGAPPDPFEGSFRLEADLSWTPADRSEAVDATRIDVTRLLGGR